MHRVHSSNAKRLPDPAGQAVYLPLKSGLDLIYLRILHGSYLIVAWWKTIVRLIDKDSKCYKHLRYIIQSSITIAAGRLTGFTAKMRQRRRFAIFLKNSSQGFLSQMCCSPFIPISKTT